MASRRLLVAIVLLSAALHAIGMARAILPAQDGLKFIRIAREFQTRPWIDVVRGADQHPLYPALVAVAEPLSVVLPGRRARDLANRRAIGLRDCRGCPALPPLRPDPRPLRRADRHPRGGHLRPAPLTERGRARHAERQPGAPRLRVGAPPGRDGRAFPRMARVGGLWARGGTGVPGASGGPGRPGGGLPRRGDARVAPLSGRAVSSSKREPLTRPAGTLSRRERGTGLVARLLPAGPPSGCRQARGARGPVFRDGRRLCADQGGGVGEARPPPGDRPGRSGAHDPTGGPSPPGRPR